MKSLKALVLVVFILGALWGVQAASAKVSYTYSGVLVKPAPGVPAVTTPGGTITLTPQKGIQITGLGIISILHGPYKLSIVGTDSAGEIEAKVPDDVVPGDYFLIVNTTSGQTIIPNGLYVMAKAPTVLNIAQVSDTHITSGAKVGYVCGNYFQRDIFKIAQYCSNPIPLHSAVAADSAYTYWAMNPNASIIINTGDDVDTAGDYAGYMIMLHIMERTALAGKPIINIKGNHDDPPTVFTKLIGPRYFYDTIGRFLIIGLDSRGDEGHPSMAQLEWMENVLENHKGYTVIVLVHHPFWYKASLGKYGGYVNGSAFNDTSWNRLLNLVTWYWSGGPSHPTANIARRFLEDVEKYNITLIMSGHIHNDKTVIYTDPEGHVHWFATLTATGAPDKETNPPSKPGRKPTWYGSNLITVYLNGTVKMTPVMKEFGTLFGNFTSLPVPQRFIVFRHHGPDGTAVEFINEYKPASGPVVFSVPEGAGIDSSATNLTYKLIGERTIGGVHYVLLNITVPLGKWQIVFSKGKDTQKPQLTVAYTLPSKPRPGVSTKVYIMASDNIGIRDLYAQVYDGNGHVVSYKKMSLFPAEPTSGKENNKYYVVQLPALNKSNYEVKFIAVDFYGNKAVKTLNFNFAPTSSSSSSTSSSSSSSSTSSSSSSSSSSSTSSTSSSSSSTSSTSSSSSSTSSSSSSSSSSSPSSTPSSSSSKSRWHICGPAAIIALAALPLLLRKRK